MLKLATCNEPWKDIPVEEVFRRIAQAGFVGVEIAPFTLAEDIRTINAARRKEIAKAANDLGLKIVGLHWLFVSPKGLHLTTPDANVRKQSLEFLKALADFCGDLGGGVMVFGSPKQRDIVAPTTYTDGWNRAKEIYAAAADHCAQRNVTVCIEALSPKDTNFINTVEEAARMADEIHHPAIDIMIDTKAMSSMPGGVVENVLRFGKRAKHFHANEPSGKGVAMPIKPDETPNVNWKEVLGALKQSEFEHWISCEPFDYLPDPDTVARTAIQTLTAAMA
jgi:sugar phosphate isomerase/epimerase